MPVVIPNGVQVEVDGSNVHVKGPKGEVERTFSPEIEISYQDGIIEVKRKSD
jgi:large subunit ribosomal protein L6